MPQNPEPESKRIFWQSLCTCLLDNSARQLSSHKHSKGDQPNIQFTLIYINDLPNSLRGAVPRVFADDTNLTLST